MATGGEISGVEEPEAGAVPGLTHTQQQQQPDVDTGSTDEQQQSDAVREYTCSPCSQNDVTTEATHYCPECNVCYCKACLCDHAVLGRAKIFQWGKTTTERIGSRAEDDEQEDKCLQHPDYTVTMYCVEHDVLCCQLGYATEHRLCKNIEKLSVAAEIDNIGDSVKTVQDEMGSLEINTEALTKNREIRKQFVESSYMNKMKQLNELQENVNAKFDAVKEDARIRKKYYIDNFCTEMHRCQNITEKLARLKRTIKHTEDKQERFVNVKWAREWVGKKQKDVTSMLGATFTEVFQHTPRVAEVKALNVVTEAIHVKMAGMKFSIETSRDKHKSDIVGICRISDGGFVLADKANKCLKQLDADYTVISRYNLQDTPRGICASGDSEVAVAMDNKKILIVDIGSAFENVRILEFDHPCTKVVFHDEKLYITYTPSCSSSWCYCKTDIHIYDKSGKALQQMTADIEQHNRSAYDSGSPLCISEDGEKIYVAHRTCLVVLDSQGRKITLSQDYKAIVGLCFDTNGYLYVSIGGSNEIVKLSQEGTGGFKRVNTVTSSLDATSATGVICFDKRLGRIVICQAKSSYIYLENFTY